MTEETIITPTTTELPQPIMKVFVPKQENVNYHGEWIFQLGVMCYGVICRKKDNKVLITYNINADNLHPDHFDIVFYEDVPKGIYKMLQQKLAKDIEWVDTTMINLINNKKMLSEIFNFAETTQSLGKEDEYEVLPYTDDDQRSDAAIRQGIQTTTKLNLWQKKARNKSKLAKKARKSK